MQISSWDKISHLSQTTPPKRWGQASCTIQNELIIFGGFSENKYYNDIWAFDSLTLQWKEVITVGDIPEERSHATLNLHSNGKDLVLFGGGSKNKERFNSVHFLNWQTKEWTLIQVPQYQNTPEQRTYHTANIIGKYLVVFGGESLVDLGDLWLFDLEAQIWTEIITDNYEEKPSARRFHASCQRNNELIIVGGCKQKYKTFQDIYTLKFDKFFTTQNPQHLIWKQVPIALNNFYLGRWGHSVSYNEINGRLYLFGGRNNQGDQNSLIQIDLNHKQIAPMNFNANNRPCARRKHCANFMGNSLLVFGGFNGQYFNDLHSIEIFSLHNIENDEDADLKEFVNQLQMKYDSETVMDIESEQKTVENIQEAEALEDLLNKTLFSQIGFDVEDYLSSAQKIWEESEPQSKQASPTFKKSTKVPGIAILRDKQFQKYIRDNILIHENNKFNPELEQCQYFTRMIKQETYKFFSTKKQQVQIEIEGHYKLLVSGLISAKNKYFENCLKEGNKIHIANIKDAKDIKILEVCIISIKEGILVVSQSFTLEDWIKLLELSDYFCAHTLFDKIQKFLVEQSSLTLIHDLIPVSIQYKLPNLSNKCSQLIITQHYQKFLQQNSEIKQKYITDKFNEFQAELMTQISDQTIYPAKFTWSLVRYLKNNHFGMIVRVMKTLRENKERQKEEDKDDKQNGVEGENTD